MNSTDKFDDLAQLENILSKPEPNIDTLTVDEQWNQIDSLATDRLSRFVATIGLLIEKNEKFEYLLAAGDSGSAITYLVELIFKQLGLPLPIEILLPVFRTSPIDENAFDNKIIHWTTGKALTGEDTILFVDDEIAKGNSLKESVKILRNATDSKLKITIVAEDHGFDLQTLKEADLQLDFFPYGHSLGELTNVIMYSIPLNLVESIKNTVTGRELEQKQLFCLLAGNPIKDFNSGFPKFTHDLAQRVSEEVDLPLLQKQFGEFMQKFIKDIIK